MYIIHSLGHSSYECKVLNYFCYKYRKVSSTKERRQDPAFKKKFEKQKKNNAMVQHAVDEIILKEKEKLIVKYEIHDNIDNESNEDELYEHEKNILDEKK